MKVISKLNDKRINSDNYMVEMNVKEYLSLIKNIFNQNEFQRKRVSSSKSVYSLLKNDILKGCLIPPIVLALTSFTENDVKKEDDFGKFLFSNKDNLVILDGLQRSYTLKDLEDELTLSGDEINLNIFLDLILRFEIYVGVNRLGILYRMLTLNTGQTPMSTRQQIEMLYLDYSKQEIEGITLIRESENRTPKKINEYNFRDTLEGFNSYLERNELPIERTDLLENIRSLEKLSRENEESDIYRDFLLLWNSFILKINTLTKDSKVSDDFEQAYTNLFGKDAISLFKKAQTISGFGAAIGRLKDFELVSGFDEVQKTIENKLHLDHLTEVEFLELINKKIYEIGITSKKIGNSQRMFFQYFFRDLFNKESDSFTKLDVAVESAYTKYNSQVA